MKILIHGRKNGYSVLYPKPTPTEFYSFASDIQSISANNDGVYYGNFFYTLAFVDGGCIFTKYIIGDDVERGQLGEIGISVYIPNTRKLSGAEVKSLLDELIDTYSSNYITDNKIDEPKNGFNWLLINSLANSYDVKLQSISVDDIENMLSGDTDNSFLYFKDTIELQKYFDAPYQEEYAPYRQILFINNDLKGKPENPLNALRHSENDLTGKIDLENPPYKLREFHRSGKNGVEIKIQNSKGRELYNKDTVYRKEELTLVYSKKYHHEKRIVGSLLNNEELQKYLVVSSDNKIDVVKVIELTPEKKTITFDVITKKDGAKVTDAEIKIGDNEDWKKISEYTFKAEELGKQYKISARKGINLFCDNVPITPKDYSEDSITLPLPLVEKKVVKIIVIEAEGEKDNILDFKVWVSNGKCNTQKISEVTFTGDEIDNTWNITVEKEGYKRSCSVSYYPKNSDSTIHFELEKTPDQKKTKDDQPSLDKEEKQKSFAAKAKIFFSKPSVIVTSIVSVLVLGVGIWALCDFFCKPKQIQLTAVQINSYVEGDSLMLEKLKDFKEKWKSQEQNFITKSGGGPFGGEEKTDSIKWKSDWHPAYESIERAITKRDLINNKNFEELKKLRYSPNQQSFKTAIKKIDSTKYAEVGQKLGDVSVLTLTQITGKIFEIPESKEPTKKDTIQEQKKEEGIVEQSNQHLRKTTQKNTTAQPATTNTSDKNQDITKEEKQQEKFQNAFWDIVYKSSIPLKEDFETWYITGTEISYLNEYKVFYNQHLSVSRNFENLKDFFKKPVMDRKRVKTLDDLKNQIK